MSSGIVTGQTGRLCPQNNLLTNGQLEISQRGFGGGPVPVKNGDYVADCWYIGDNSVDELRCGTWQGIGGIYFHGTGKKGQWFTLNHRPIEENYLIGFREGGDNGKLNYALTLTASITNPSSSTQTVPISCAARPIFNGAHNYLEFDDKITTNPNNAYQTYHPVCCISQDELSRNKVRAHLICTLEEDGDFVFYVHDIIMLSGKYKNPPKHVPVPYADDLARCQRYYQKSDIKTRHNGLFSTYQSGPFVESYHMQYLKVPMASTPSYSLTARQVHVWNGSSTTDRIDVCAIDVTENSPKEFQVRTYTTDPTVAGQLLGDGARTEYEWTAEVV